MNGLNRTTLRVIASIAIFGLTYGLSAPLISLQLAALGHGETYVGLSAGMYAMGVFAIAPFLPTLTRRFRPSLLIAGSLAALAILMMLFVMTPPPAWFALRFGLGIFSEIIMVQTETWLSDSTVESTRARTMAMYTAGLSAGFACGPLILVITGSDGGLPFAVGAAIALLACLSLRGTRMGEVTHAQDGAPSFMRCFKLAALAIAATALNAAVEVAGLNFLSLYTMSLGWSEQQGTLAISVLMLGAILFQLPIGWLADRLDRRRFMVTLSAMATAGVLVWPYVLAYPLLSYLLLFVWGGVFVGIYTIAITWVGSLFKGATLAGVYAAMSVAWGMGALLGPVLGGFSMTLTRHGLPLLIACLCGAFTLFIMRRSAWRTTAPAQG